MKRLVLALPIALLMACSGGTEETTVEQTDTNAPPTKEERLKDINALEEKLFRNVEHYDEGAAHAIVREYSEFVDNYPDDPKSPEYLFRAGEVSSSLKRSIESVKYYQKLEKEYPEYEKLADALFLQGYVFENQLQDYDRARECYERFMKEYPSHHMVEQTKVILDQLGKTPEELIKEIEAKQES